MAGGIRSAPNDGSTRRRIVPDFSLRKLADDKIGPIDTLPFSIRVLLEACLRKTDNFIVREADVVGLANWKGRLGAGRSPVHARSSRVAGLHRRARRGPTWRPCAARWSAWGAIRRRSTRSCSATSSSTTRCRWTNSVRPWPFAQRRARIRAEYRALPVAALGAEVLSRTSAWSPRRRASCIRSTLSTSPGLSSKRTAWCTLTASWGPTVTRR